MRVIIIDISGQRINNAPSTKTASVGRLQRFWYACDITKDHADPRTRYPK